MQEKTFSKTGITRVIAACVNSWHGLKAGFRHEAAFRQELLLVAIALLALVALPFAAHWKGILFLATLAVLMVELLNSAVEAVVDLVSPEYHELAKRAKDLASAAVMLSIITAAILWAYALYLLLLQA